MGRLTYKSSMGDYGSAKHFDDEWEEKCALRNALGKYEDLGCTPEELQNVIDNIKHANHILEKMDVKLDDNYIAVNKDLLLDLIRCLGKTGLYDNNNILMPIIDE